MGKFTFIETGIKDLYVIEPTVFGDNRGYFMETYNDEFKPYIKHLDGTPAEFLQDNQSKSKKGVLRGLHFQKQNPQGKLVRCLEGEVYDVAVDLRKDSETYEPAYSSSPGSSRAKWEIRSSTTPISGSSSANRPGNRCSY